MINVYKKYLIDDINRSYKKAVFYFFIKSKKYILRASEKNGKIYLVYVMDEKTGEALFSQTPRGIIKIVRKRFINLFLINYPFKVCQKFHEHLDYKGRSWRCIFYKGRSLFSYRKILIEEKMLEYLCIFEGVEDSYVEDIDGIMCLVVETNKTKEELKKMNEIFNNERIIVKPTKKFKNECHTPDFNYF